MEGERLVYSRTGHGGRPKGYIWSDPEEKVRAWFYVQLVEQFKYPVERIDLEVEVYRRKPEDFADIVVYEDDGLSRPYIVVECKRSDISAAEQEQALKQTWGNANNLGAAYACYVIGAASACFDPRSFDLKQRDKCWVNLPERYGKPIKFKRQKGSDDWDLSPTTLDSLRTRFQNCHDVLWEGGKRNPAQAFDEMTKLMFCKLRDETTLTADGEFYGFQIGSNETPSEVATRVKGIYQQSKAVAQTVFRSSINVDDDILYRVVDVLQDISLYRTDLDAKGKAFERFLSTVFRGDMGQYFTPRNVVECVVDILRPAVADRLIDPACGSGGFLLYSLERIQSIAKRRFKDPIERRDYWKKWAQRGLHGIEISDQISRVAMMGMILHEDGHTHISFADSLENFTDLQRVNVELKRDSFTVLMTNPPFESSIKRSSPKAKHKYLDDYQFGLNRPSQRKEIIFIERCLDFLSPGGRMGIVLPDSVLNNPSLHEVRSFIEDRAFLDAVISLPVETFISSGAFVKTSIVFLKKYLQAEKNRFMRERKAAIEAALEKHKDLRERLLKQRGNSLERKSFDQMIRAIASSNTRTLLNYSVFFASAESVGVTATGKVNENDLPSIAEKYHIYRSSNPLKFGVV